MRLDNFVKLELGWGKVSDMVSEKGNSPDFLGFRFRFTVQLQRWVMVLNVQRVFISYISVYAKPISHLVNMAATNKGKQT